MESDIFSVYQILMGLSTKNIFFLIACLPCHFHMQVGLQTGYALKQRVTYVDSYFWLRINWHTGLQIILLYFFFVVLTTPKGMCEIKFLGMRRGIWYLISCDSGTILPFVKPWSCRGHISWLSMFLRLLVQ